MWRFCFWSSHRGQEPQERQRRGMFGLITAAFGGGGRRVGAGAAAGSAAAPDPALAEEERLQRERESKRHVIFLVHGLFGSRANWRVISGFLQEQLDPPATLLHVSSVNEYTKVPPLLSSSFFSLPMLRSSAALQFTQRKALAVSSCAPSVSSLPPGCGSSALGSWREHCHGAGAALSGPKKFFPTTPHGFARICPKQAKGSCAPCTPKQAQTYDGIDVCGERLADEMRRVVALHPRLERLSIVGHSMGGLISRYAAGEEGDANADVAPHFL